MKRRDFLALGASALAFIEAHHSWGMSTFPVREPAAVPLIKSIDILTNASISVMREFYEKTLGFAIDTVASNSLSVAGGASIVNFKKIESAERPFYHFAFNIPENKIDVAFRWLRKRTEVVHPNPAGQRDAIVNFAHWNAHSIFFLDPAGNLVEFIARHDLKNSADGDFSINDIQCLSEIAFIVDDVQENGNMLMKTLDLREYKPIVNSFWPIGDEMGLLLMIKNDRTWTGLPGQVNRVGVFKTTVQLNRPGQVAWKSELYPYEAAGK